MEMNRDNIDMIQSACNPVAVANTFAEWVTAEFHKTKSMEGLKENNLLLATLGKLCDLFCLEHDGAKAYRYLNNKG